MALFIYYYSLWAVGHEFLAQHMCHEVIELGRNEKIRILLQMLMKDEEVMQRWRVFTLVHSSLSKAMLLEEVWALVEENRKGFCALSGTHCPLNRYLLNMQLCTPITNSFILQLSNSCQTSRKKNLVKENTIKLVFFK